MVICNGANRMSMKVGPIDFEQPSTWRGLAGVIAVFGISLNPALTDQIAIALGAALSAVEIFRDEYARAKLPPITLQHEALVSLADRATQQLRQPVPTEPESSPPVSNPTGFGDR
jgi:hypothetical protein